MQKFKFYIIFLPLHSDKLSCTISISHKNFHSHKIIITFAVY